MLTRRDILKSLALPFAGLLLPSVKTDEAKAKVLQVKLPEKTPKMIEFKFSDPMGPRKDLEAYTRGVKALKSFVHVPSRLERRIPLRLLKDKGYL
jgi:hypothetical protein